MAIGGFVEALIESLGVAVCELGADKDVNVHPAEAELARRDRVASSAWSRPLNAGRDIFWHEQRDNGEQVCR